MYTFLILRLTCVLDIDTSETQTAQPCNKKDGEEQRKEETVIFEDDFSLWCQKMSVFFQKKFFPAAAKYELLNKIAHENV